MHYSVEHVSPSSQLEMINFLKEHDNTSLFLLGNFESYGAKLSEAPYSGNYKLVRCKKQIVAVFSLTRKGSLLIESKVREPIFEVVLEACLQEPIPLRGLLGDWTFCEFFWEFLKTKKIIQKEISTSKEILYSVNLQKQEFAPQHHVRLLTEFDFVQWKPLRLAYIVEEGFPNDLTESQLFEQYLEKVKRKIAWGLFLNNTLVSMADLNAKAFDLGQVGGVYTAPNFRQKGYSRSLMQQLLLDAKNLHRIRKLIIFTGEKNIPAQKLYKSLGVTQVGHFALHFGN